MAKIRYIPEPGTPAHHTHLGIEWGPDAIRVTDPNVIAKCKGSPFYEVDGFVYKPTGFDEDEDTPKRKPAAKK